MTHPARSLRMARILFALVLLFAALAPAALLAQSDLVGTYESDVIDTGADDSEGLIVTISLFEDGTQETVSDFQDGETPVFEQGDWVDNEDGTITISFIVSNGEFYDEPVDVLFEVNDDTLTAPDLTDYGDDGLVVTRVDDEPVSGAEEFGFEATADVVAAARAGGDEEAVDDDIFDIEGVYVSDELIDDTGTGAVLIFMTEDGLVQSLFNNFDGVSAPVGRLGTWEETDEGIITITLDQELVIDGEDAEATDLDDAESVELELINGILVSDEFSLYPVDEISELWSAEEINLEDEEAAAGDDETVTFATTADAMEAGQTVVAIATQDGEVTMSVQVVDTDTDTVLVGVWEQTDDGILFSFDTDEDGNELDPAVEVLFEEQEDGSLVGVDFDTDLFGEELVLEMQE